MNEQDQAKAFLSYVNITKVSQQTGIHRNTLYKFLNGETKTLHAYNLQKVLKLRDGKEQK